MKKGFVALLLLAVSTLPVCGELIVYRGTFSSSRAQPTTAVVRGGASFFVLDTNSLQIRGIGYFGTDDEKAYIGVFGGNFFATTTRKGSAQRLTLSTGFGSNDQNGFNHGYVEFTGNNSIIKVKENPTVQRVFPKVLSGLRRSNVKNANLELYVREQYDLVFNEAQTVRANADSSNTVDSVISAFAQKLESKGYEFTLEKGEH